MELPCRTLARVQCIIDWLTALSVHAALQMIFWCLLLLNQVYVVHGVGFGTMGEQGVHRINTRQVQHIVRYNS